MELMYLCVSHINCNHLCYSSESDPTKLFLLSSPTIRVVGALCPLYLFINKYNRLDPLDDEFVLGEFLRTINSL